MAPELNEELPMWTPPDNPDRSEILHSPVENTDAGQYEQALAKFLWYHNHALQHGPGQGGVRLSFALRYWQDLGEVYPPALEAFKETRDKTEAAFQDSWSDFHLFHDLAAMNRRLDESARTADLFEAAAAIDLEAAQDLYHVAERSLIAVGRYHACEPFLHPEQQLEQAAELFAHGTEWENSRPEREFPAPKTARRFYVSRVATQIALLVINLRTEEAHRAYYAALQLLDDAEFRQVLNDAMTGQLPHDLF